MIVQALFGSKPLHERLNEVKAHLRVGHMHNPYWCDENGCWVLPPHGVMLVDTCVAFEDRTGQTAFYDVGEGTIGGWVSLVD